MLANTRRTTLPCIITGITSLLLLSHLYRLPYTHLAAQNAVPLFGGVRLGSSNDSRADYIGFAVPPRGGVPPSREIARYGRLLLQALADARPQTDEVVRLRDGATADVHDETTPTLTDLVHISSDLRAALAAAHARFKHAARALGAQLPYDFNKKDKTPPAPSRGIVMTAGGRYVGIAVTSILMLRRTGSRLPVQLFLDSDADYAHNARLCDDVLPALGVACHVVRRILGDGPLAGALAGYQLKVFAILVSSFQQVLFLDADCWPVHRPDGLFAAAPFAATGLVMWPDFWLSTASPDVYNVTGMPVPARPRRERTSESGVMLWDKQRHGTSLVMAAYYNVYGPAYYYALLSQGAAGQGDKETFLHGAKVMGNAFHAVATPVTVLGRHLQGAFHSAGMRQADPADPADPARTMFVHHNLIKVDVLDLGSFLPAVRMRDEAGRLSRVWGPVAGELRADYDVEQALWEQVQQAACPDDTMLTSTDCRMLREYYEAVFV